MTKRIITTTGASHYGQTTQTQRFSVGRMQFGFEKLSNGTVQASMFAPSGKGHAPQLMLVPVDINELRALLDAVEQD